MAQPVELLAFNRGRISPLGIARKDIKRVAFSAETQTNWMPRTLGSMMLRPGLKYVGATASNNQAWTIPFVFGAEDTAILELTGTNMRVWIDETALTRPSVSTAVSNGTFNSNLTGWTDSDDTGASSAWSATNGASMALTCTAHAAASRTQTVSLGGGNADVEHALRVDVRVRPVVLRVGSASGLTDYIDAELAPGLHSLAFTPSGTFYIDIRNRLPGFAEIAYVNSIVVESSGIVSITAPWSAADLPFLRHAQSADVVFAACDGYKQQKIERRGTGRSWSIVDYRAENGPFLPRNVTSTTLTGNAVSLTASQPYFNANHIGAIFELNYPGQDVQVSAGAENQFSSAIRVSGVDDSREFQLTIAGTFVAVVELQLSYDETTWSEVNRYVGAGTVAINDGLDNQVLFYRIGVPTGDYTSGTAVCDLNTIIGTQHGLCEVTVYTSPTVVTVTPLNRAFQDVSSGITTAWSEGAWSTHQGFPTSVALHEGRLWFAGRSKIWGSVSDAFDSHDDQAVVGDSAPISRNVGDGPVDVIPWLISLERLVAGSLSAEFTIKSSGFDEPLTPAAFKVVSGSTQGVADVQAVKVDDRAMFVQRSDQRLYELVFDASSDKFTAMDLTALVPEIGEGDFVRIAVQRKPDTRIHCVRADGTAAVLIFDQAEKVLCWVDVVVGGTSVAIEDVVVLPATEEDAVYYVVRRVINSSTVRFLERWALESKSQGPLEVRCSDSHLVVNQSSSTTISGLTHLEGETVVVWGWHTGTPFTVTLPDGSSLTIGRDLSTYTVSSGAITVSTAVTDAIVGLAYSATFKSVKLGDLIDTEKMGALGLALQDAHYQGLKYGMSTGKTEFLPEMSEGTAVGAHTVFPTLDVDDLIVPGEWTNDARLVLTAASPRPATVLAAKIRWDE